MAKFKGRRTKGWTTQWPNLNERQKDGQHNDQIYTKDKRTDNTMTKFKRNKDKGTNNTMTKFKRNKDKGTDNTMTKFKRRRTKGRTTQWPNLNEGQRDGQFNDQI